MRETLVLLFHLFQAYAQAPTVINVGLLFSANDSSDMLTVSYENIASAVLIARDRIIEEQILPNITLNFVLRFSNCDELLASDAAVDMMKDGQADVIIGPVCSNPTIDVGILGSYYDYPIITYGLSTDAALTDLERFPTTIVMSSNTKGLGLALVSLLNEYQWYQFAFVYATNYEPGKCDTMRSDLQYVLNVDDSPVEMKTAIWLQDVSDSSVARALADVKMASRSEFQTVVDSDPSPVTMIYQKLLLDTTNEGMKLAMNDLKNQARVVVICLSDNYGLKRRFMLAASDAGYVTDEYVFIYADIKSQGFNQPTKNGSKYIWQADGEAWADGRDADAQQAFQNAFSLNDMMGIGDTNQWTSFSSEVVRRMNESPFNCGVGCRDPTYTTAGAFSGQLHDSLLVYAFALNTTLERNASYYRVGTELLRNSGVDFEGIGGRIVVGEGGIRMPTFFFSTLNESLLPNIYGKVMINNSVSNFTRLYTSEAVLFCNYDSRSKPPDVPVCGFTGSKCPPDFVATYLPWIIAAAVVISFFIGIAMVGAYMTIASKRKALEEENRLWQIPFSLLADTQKKSKFEQSVRSMTSSKTGSSVATRTTHESKVETRRFKFYLLQGDKIACLKHAVRTRLGDEECFELRKLRAFDHDNVNRFLGLCLDGPELMSAWKYCGRGSLQDVVHKSDSTMDYFFIYCLLKDIVGGLQFIHSSFIGYHGNLTSETCLVDDRFQVKLAYFGLREIRRNDTPTNEELLWTAPEILRGANEGSTTSDIYSFAIICSELVTKKSAWDINNRKEPAETIIYWLKRSRHPPPRPELHIHESLEMNTGLLELIKDCWDEDPTRRPTVNQIRQLLRGMNGGRTDNLMDHVFNIMETYAVSLEEEVASRMQELIEEKKKSDVLLYRMLPRTVADKLKLGQSVPPESFESVTVFFSDVVSFTTLAAKCTPLQVVNLLNDLYSIFDGIINEHDVYKVETIGDGYLCVSGLPKRNGSDHVRQIASMSLAFMKALIEFRIPHLPAERVNIRVGMHTGSVVAGVVGLTMPRYCLFGDTVNTASRMESNGKPGMIHLSPEANRMLTKVIGGFVTEPRGEVIIKGKGVMETFWLLGCSDDSKLIIDRRDIPQSPPPQPRSVSPASISSILTDRQRSAQGLYAAFRSKSSPLSSASTRRK